jgi:hypothetical protein
MRLALPVLPGFSGRRRGQPRAGSRLALPFALMPQWLVAVDRDGKQSAWRIRRRWDGRPRLEPRQLPAGKGCIVALDPDLPYRRKLQRFPATARARRALLRAAPDEFPLPAEAVRYALGTRGGDGYLLALPEQELTRLREAGLNAAAIVTAGEGLDEAGCLAALATIEKQGETASFARGKRLLPRSWLRPVVLAVSLLLLAGAAAQLLLGPDLLGNAIAWRNEQMRREAGDLPRLYATTETMAASHAAAAKLRALPEARAAAVLGQILATVPPGHGIRRIEIANGTLRLAGSGADVQDWLTAAGFPANGIVVEKIGSLQTWRAELPL